MLRKSPDFGTLNTLLYVKVRMDEKGQNSQRPRNFNHVQWIPMVYHNFSYSWMALFDIFGALDPPFSETCFAKLGIFQVKLDALGIPDQQVLVFCWTVIIIWFSYVLTCIIAPKKMQKSQIPTTNIYIFTFTVICVVSSVLSI